MNLTIFTHMTNPDKRMDPREAIKCYEYFADDIVTVGQTGPMSSIGIT